MKLKYWLLILPAVLLVAINSILPFIAAFNYSLNLLHFGRVARYVGFDMYKQLLLDPVFQGALLRNLEFSGLILAIEIPLGLIIGKYIPKKGVLGGAALMIIAMPLVIPWVTVGMIFKNMATAGGILPSTLSIIGINYSMSNPTHLFTTIIVLDVWHWTPLVALICAAGYKAMPEEPIQAAKIDRASGWKIFRHVELPQLRFPLLIAILLRFMDSFRIYDAPFVIAGKGPEHATTFLTTYLATKVLGEFNLGLGGACAMVYFFISLSITFILFLIITKGKGFSR